MRDFTTNRFDEPSGTGGIGDLPNLADLMLVFAVGLIAAMASSGDHKTVREEMEMGQELPELPTSADAAGNGLEAVGRVYKDPETGKLYVVK